jgi:hypothetical protein
MDWFRLLGFFMIGKVCMYFLQTFPLTYKIADEIDKRIHYEFLGKLVRCNLCLGVWVYSFWVFGLQMYPNWYIPVVSEFTIGALASFIMFVFELGWQERFTVINIGG